VFLSIISYLVTNVYLQSTTNSGIYSLNLVVSLKLRFVFLFDEKVIMSGSQLMNDEALFIVVWGDGSEMSKPTHMTGYAAEKILTEFHINYKIDTYHSWTYMTFRVNLKDHRSGDDFSNNLIHAIDEESLRYYRSRA
jgi:hypothetical protein